MKAKNTTTDSYEFSPIVLDLPPGRAKISESGEVTILVQTKNLDMSESMDAVRLDLERNKISAVDINQIIDVMLHALDQEMKVVALRELIV
jgi:hypothetical protein